MASPRAAGPGPAITAIVLAVSCLTIMANATIAPSLPGLAAAFADVPNIETLSGLVLSLPSLAIVLTAGLAGALADRIERKWLLAAAMALYAAGGASGLVATTLPQLLAGRVLLGIGVAGTMTVATILAAEYWSGAARVRLMGRQAAAMSAGGIAFLLLGGLLAGLSWRGPFAIYLAALPLALAVMLGLLGRAAPAGPAPDGAAPMPWRVVARIGALAFFTMAMFYVIPTRLPFLLTEIGIDAPLAAGAAIAAVTAASTLSALAFPALRARMGPQAIFGASFLLMAAGYALIATAGGLPQVIAGTLVVGFGLGATMPNQLSWLMAEVPEAARGRAAGLLTTLVFAGQLASPLLAGLLATAFPLGAVFGLFAAVLALLGAILLGLELRQQPRKGGRRQGPGHPPAVAAPTVGE
ncbi:putative MFS family arabinose efflux permease [Hasllibacter halocynthiae]|uniref:Putative MFS family arabinose efflux permease n=1 Tax=Hasllibacter halocynthiae TaxID=595589 RepID=A0A2T0WZH1_9RHOB|nr:MFS transporter [Hasllibacter halocynthiae]PRY92067.1 putative MFS family arabinose efflux permease [Hasllibacter halocynthiae]